MKEKATYRAMTDLEHDRAMALGKCTFPTASFSKRFARNLRAQLTNTATITERQAALMAVQCYIYRRQFRGNDAHLVPANPPPGYQTPRQRQLAAELASCFFCHQHKGMPPAGPQDGTKHKEGA